MLKVIIFDCFGVIYPQASGVYLDKRKELFQNHTEEIGELNLRIDLGEISRAEYFVGLEKVTGVSAKEIQDEVDRQLRVDQGLIDVIKKLKAKYKIGMLSNAGKEEIDIIYRDKIDSLFDALAVSYEVKSVKPNAEIFLVCLDRLGVKAEEALLVDDSMVNIKAAQDLGLQTLYYPKFGNMPKDLTELARF
ncbi:MAG TPA: HAD-IA family hydrolase [Candidatus Saccharimonadales bacterium]|nr:HAD-IA family hydrolase [Candidatus Saccharimonadales bacterium]